MIRLLFCGDTVPTEDNAHLFKAGDSAALFHDVLPCFAEADRVIVNLECALTETDGAIRKFGPNIKAPVESAQTLRNAGVTDCSLANNHMLDFGVRGMRDTIAAIERSGMDWFGAGENDADARKPFIIEQNGHRIGILAVVEHEYTYALPDQPGAAPFDPFDTIVDIAKLKKECAAVVVLYHGGKEQCEYPSPRLRKACHAMAQLGADLVLCQHSHIIGCTENVGDSVIVYGTGNFSFVQFKYAEKAGWTRGLMVKADYDGRFHIEYIPVVMEGRGIRLATEREKKDILAGFARRSQTLQDGSWLAGWAAFCESVRSLYTDSVRNAYADERDERRLHRFAHYLDCEAHLDVYRQMYPTWHANKTDGSSEPI